MRKVDFIIFNKVKCIKASCRRAAATICPTLQAYSGSAQRQPWARPAEPGPISQYAPSSRPTAHAARRPDVRDRRQTDRRQTASSLNAPSVGHNKDWSSGRDFLVLATIPVSSGQCVYNLFINAIVCLCGKYALAWSLKSDSHLGWGLGYLEAINQQNKVWRLSMQQLDSFHSAMYRRIVLILNEFKWQ